MAKLIRRNQQMDDNQISDTFNKMRRFPGEVNWISELAKGARVVSNEDDSVGFVMMANVVPGASTGVCIRKRAGKGPRSGEILNPSYVLAQTADGKDFEQIGWMTSHKTEKIDYFKPDRTNIRGMNYPDEALYAFEIHDHPDWPLGYQKSCYIATYVYGSYDSPEVCILRRYRDNTLSESSMGRFFIRMYYTLSPVIIALLGGMKWFNAMGRFFLDKFVSRLKSKGMDDSPYTDS